MLKAFSLFVLEMQAPDVMGPCHAMYIADHMQVRNNVCFGCKLEV